VKERSDFANKSMVFGGAVLGNGKAFINIERRCWIYQSEAYDGVTSMGAETAYNGMDGVEDR
jgi:hypothetical protein